MILTIFFPVRKGALSSARLTLPFGYLMKMTKKPFTRTRRLRNTEAATKNFLFLRMALLPTRNETSYCLAISPDKNAFLIGTSIFIHLYDREGNQKWQSLPPSYVYSVNISGNGRVAAAAL